MNYIENIRHIDGVWKTSEHYYKDRKILIKAQRGKGVKAHIFYPNSDDKVQKTFRYRFMMVADLKKKVMEIIDNLDNKQGL